MNLENITPEASPLASQPDATQASPLPAALAEVIDKPQTMEDKIKARKAAIRNSVSISSIGDLQEMKNINANQNLRASVIETSNPLSSSMIETTRPLSSSIIETSNPL